jgi:branched-chain amino acid transport system permease protein
MTVLQAIVTGMALAAVYALLGLGFVIIFKSMNVLSFAQPALMLWGGWWVVYFATIANWNFYLAVLIAVVIAAITGLVVERLFLRPMVGKSIFAVAIMTIGIDLVVRTISGNFYDINIRSTGDPWGLKSFNLGGILINYRRVAALVVAIVLVIALLAFFRFSRMGLAMRAAAFDQEVALIQGVSALKALPVVVIGGLDSIGGTLVAALIIGLVESFTNSFQPTYAAFLGRNLSQVMPYVVMFIVLLIRPYGLFGTKEVERV